MRRIVALARKEDTLGVCDSDDREQTLYAFTPYTIESLAEGIPSFAVLSANR